MKINRQNRKYTSLYIKLTGSQRSYYDNEYLLGLTMLKSMDISTFIYNDWKKSTVYWNWFAQQMENITMQALYAASIDQSSIEISLSDRVDLKHAWEFFYKAFADKCITPSQTIIKQITKEQYGDIKHHNSSQSDKTATRGQSYSSRCVIDG